MANPDGTPIWYELMTTDANAAQAFYADIVGWSIADPGMPGTGDYRILTIEAAVEKVKAGGGTIHQGPHEVPGGAWIVLGADPQGAAFALTGGK